MKKTSRGLRGNFDTEDTLHLMVVSFSRQNHLRRHQSQLVRERAQFYDQIFYDLQRLRLTVISGCFGFPSFELSSTDECRLSASRDDICTANLKFRFNGL